MSVAAETANSYVSLRTCERQLADRDRTMRQSRAETARLAELSARAGFTAPADCRAGARQRRRRHRPGPRSSARSATSRSRRWWPSPRCPSRALRQGLAQGPDASSRRRRRWRCPRCRPQVLAQRPDVYQAEREVAAASAEVGSAQAQRFPRLTLSGSIAAGTRRMPAASAPTCRPGPSARWRSRLPIFDGGRRAANVDAAQARYEEAAALYAARVRQAVREVEEALVNLESARLRSRGRARRAGGLPRFLRRHRGTLSQRPGQPGGTGRRPPHGAGGRDGTGARCSANALRPGSPCTGPWAAAGSGPTRRWPRPRAGCSRHEFLNSTSPTMRTKTANILAAIALGGAGRGRVPVLVLRCEPRADSRRPRCGRR